MGFHCFAQHPCCGSGKELRGLGNHRFGGLRRANCFDRDRRRARDRRLCRQRQHPLQRDQGRLCRWRSGGGGTLVFHGRRYPLAIGGVSYGFTFGASATDFVGTVSNIRRPSDVNGGPIRAETRARLIEGIAKGRLWLSELVSKTSASTQKIATRERCSERSVRMTLSLAFLNPALVKSAIEGTLPYGVGITQFIDPPLDWDDQLARLS